MKVCSCCERIYVAEKDFLRQTTRWRMSEDGHLYFNCSCNSTLVIPKNKHPWYRPDRFMSKRAASVFNRFSNQMQFPLLSKAALEAGKLVSDEKSSVADIAEQLALDPVLSLWVLELSNAARPVTSAPIRNLVQAIGILGRLRIQEILTVTAICRFRMKTKSYSPYAYFQSAFVTAALAKEIAIRKGEADMADLAFVAGALCNVGKMLGAICFPEEIESVFVETQKLSPSSTWPQAENKLGAKSHVILGEIACALWGASPEVTNCVQRHHEPLIEAPKKEDEIGTEDRVLEHKLLSFVVFGNEMGKHLIGESHLSSPEVLSSCLRIFGYSKDDFDKLVQEFQSKLLPKVRESIARVGIQAPEAQI